MAGMNWDRVRAENKISRSGSVRAAETYSQTTKKKKKKTKQGKGGGLTSAEEGLVAQARAAAKERKVLAHERQMRLAAEARAAKAARKGAQQVQEAAARELRRKRVEERLDLDAQRRSDPAYQAKQAARQANRKRWMKSVVVVRKEGPRETVIRTGVGDYAVADSSPKDDRSK
jgi:hypothetical protein